MNPSIYKNKIRDLLNNIDKEKYNIKSVYIFEFVIDKFKHDSSNELHVRIDYNNENNDVTEVIKYLIKKIKYGEKNKAIKNNKVLNSSVYVVEININNNNNIKNIIYFYRNEETNEIRIFIEKKVRIDNNFIIEMSRQKDLNYFKVEKGLDREYNEIEYYTEMGKLEFFNEIKNNNIYNNKVFKYINSLDSSIEKERKLTKIIEEI